MNSQNDSTIATTVSPVETAPVSALERFSEAISRRSHKDVVSALRDAKEEIGVKPLRADFPTLKAHKASLNQYFAQRELVDDMIRAACDAGLELKKTYSAGMSKSGTVTLARRESVAIKPTWDAFKL